MYIIRLYTYLLLVIYSTIQYLRNFHCFEPSMYIILRYLFQSISVCYECLYCFCFAFLSFSLIIFLLVSASNACITYDEKEKLAFGIKVQTRRSSFSTSFSWINKNSKKVFVFYLIKKRCNTCDQILICVVCTRDT